jgi:hydroxypyruvate isomerase
MPKPDDVSHSRRHMVSGLGVTLGAAAIVGPAFAAPAFAASAPAGRADMNDTPSAGRLKQSVARWCFARTPIHDLCKEAKRVGLMGIDLLGPEEWSIPAQYGLVCTMGNSWGSIPVGFNRLEHHDKLVGDGEPYIARAAAAGVKRIVVFSGNRNGLSDREGIANCITGLKRLMPVAEKHGVVLCMEMLNSKVDHKDYHADHTAWAVAVAEGVNSPSFRLLYDIYHMQVMEGDVIATIGRAWPWIAHFHTAGVPGRHEIGDAQELNYRAIARAIADRGYEGVFAHEFMPEKAGFETLAEAVRICTV